jgi:hypothetical protein
MSGGDRGAGLLEAVIYGDLFDCAVTFDELWSYARTPISREALRGWIEQPRRAGVLVEKDGYFCLADRQELAALRAGRHERARRLRRQADRVARWIRLVPFIRGIVLTGSVAAEDAEPDADVDLLLIVAPERLGSVFLVLGAVSRMTGRELFCPNYYLCEDHLALGRRTHYVAREVAQAKPLAGRTATFWEANDWVREVFPNTPQRHENADRGSSLGDAIRNLFELPIRGRLGELIEARARGIARARLEHHHGLKNRPVPASIVEGLDRGVELRFHEAPMVDAIGARYEQRRKEIAAKLDAAGVLPPDEFPDELSEGTS